MILIAQAVGQENKAEEAHVVRHSVVLAISSKMLAPGAVTGLLKLQEIRG